MGDKKRIFIAFGLTDSQKSQIIDRLKVVKRSFTGVKWVRDDQLHVTILFIGEVSSSIFNECRERFRKALSNASRFNVFYSGVGVFPPIGKAKVLWVKVEASRELYSIHSSLATVFADIVEKDKRPYIPHLTLGRVKKGLRRVDVERFINKGKGLWAERAVVESVELYSSLLTPSGARYKVEESVGLGE